MDVKSVFLNGFLKKEVYVKKPPRFENEKYPNYTTTKQANYDGQLTTEKNVRPTYDGKK